MINTIQYSYSKLYNDFFVKCSRIQTSEPMCCIAIDIEHFNLFNGIYGLEQGDALLAQFISYIDHLNNENSVSAYFGMDDFAVYLPYDEKRIQSIYNDLNSFILNFTTSDNFIPAIGIYPMHEDEKVSFKMYDFALTAVKEAKHHRTHRIQKQTDENVEHSKYERQILIDLRSAMDHDEITFNLQPQCHITKKTILGAEALVRWIKKDGTVVNPGDFIPVLEKAKVIAEFDKFVWEKIVAWLANRYHNNLPVVPVSLNVSQVELTTMDVSDHLGFICEKYGLPTNLLKVEITESAYAGDKELVSDVVSNLKKQGFLTMMDDFGAGYSSLGMLENVNMDVLKLDMAFIKEKNIHSRRGITIIESVINMTKMMGMPIVVEGVETEEQVTFLRNLGCRYAQGYYFYKPMPISSFEELLEDTQKLDLRGFRNKRNEQMHVREFLDDNTFTDSMLNNILGAVAIYSLDGKDLTINRFNEQFYQAIADGKMEDRQVAIQNYVVREDHPSLYSALDDAYNHIPTGGECEIRFYKSDGRIVWFHMNFFFLNNDQNKQIFYGRVEDVTAVHEQTIQFFEVMHQQADVTLMIDLNKATVRYANSTNSLSEANLPAIDLDYSMNLTANNRIDDSEERVKFLQFFNIDRLKDGYNNARYYEEITIGFRMKEATIPTKFSIFYYRHNNNKQCLVYSFVKTL